jgi:hypothetical protein
VKNLFGDLTIIFFQKHNRNKNQKDTFFSENNGRGLLNDTTLTPHPHPLHDAYKAQAY